MSFSAHSNKKIPKQVANSKVETWGNWEFCPPCLFRRDNILFSLQSASRSRASGDGLKRCNDNHIGRSEPDQDDQKCNQICLQNCAKVRSCKVVKGPPPNHFSHVSAGPNIASFFRVQILLQWPIDIMIRPGSEARVNYVIILNYYLYFELIIIFFFPHFQITLQILNLSQFTK